MCPALSCGPLGRPIAPTPNLRLCEFGCISGSCAPCSPICDGLQCGSDGCGGTCGKCVGGRECFAGTCECVPHAETVCCGANVCVKDSCGNDEGVGAVCDNGCKSGACVSCKPSCEANACGADGCGGSCGACSDGTVCQDGQCIGATGEECSGSFDCLSEECAGGACTSRHYCELGSLALTYKDCTTSGACQLDIANPDDELTCQQVEVDYNPWWDPTGLANTNERFLCLESASCEGSGYLPCCGQGSFCGTLADAKDTFGVACCSPGEKLDTQGGSDTLCKLDPLGSYLCRDDSDCPTKWGLTRCKGSTSEAFGTCRECLASGDCPTPRPYCSNEHCVECTSDSQCPAAKSHCKDNECTECTSNTHCKEPGKATCSTGGVCVE